MWPDSSVGMQSYGLQGLPGYCPLLMLRAPQGLFRWFLTWFLADSGPSIYTQGGCHMPIMWPDSSAVRVLVWCVRVPFF